LIEFWGKNLRSFHDVDADSDYSLAAMKRIIGQNGVRTSNHRVKCEPGVFTLPITLQNICRGNDESSCECKDRKMMQRIVG